MKTTFYKKLVPLAMIASLALSGAGSAIAGTGFLTYNDNSIVAFAADENEATIKLDFTGTSTTITKAADFDYFDEADQVRSFQIPVKFKEKYKKRIQTVHTGEKVSANGTDVSSSTVVKEYDAPDGKVAYVAEYYSDKYSCTYDKELETWILGEIISDFTDYKEHLGSTEDSTINLDTVDLNGDKASSSESIVKSDFTFSAETNVASAELLKSIKVSNVEHQQIKDTSEGAAEDAMINNEDNYYLTIDIPAAVANGNIDILYGGVKVSTIAYTKNPKAIPETGATIEDGVLKAYKGNAKNIDLADASSVTEIGSEAFKDCKLNTVKIPSTITKIGEKAFDGCASLENVTLSNATSSSLTFVGEGAFPSSTIILAEGVKDTAKNALKNAGVKVFDPSDLSVTEGQMIISAGENIAFSCTNGSAIISDSNAAAKLNFYNSKVTAEDGTVTEGPKYSFDGADGTKKVTDYKWVLATTAGKASGAAKIKVGKKTYGSYNNITKFDITGTKANGKFNNMVKLIAVSKDVKKDYDKATVYADCTFYIKPAPVTEWNASSKGTFVAAKENDTNKPIQLKDASGNGLWIAKSDSTANPPVNYNPMQNKSVLEFNGWADVNAKYAANTWATTTVEADAWELPDGTKVVVPEMDGSEVKFTQVDSKTNFTLTITEGQSFALPIKAKNGADKTLKYDVVNVDAGIPAKDYSVTTSSNFTVVNGKVKGITEGEGTIRVTPVADHTVEPVVVKVVVTPKVAKGLTNTSALTLVGANEQKFRIGANPISSKELYYTISNVEGLDIKGSGTPESVTGENGNTDYYKLTNGAAEITVKQILNDEGTGIGTAKKSIDIQYYELKDGEYKSIGKKFSVKVNETKTGEYDNVKKFKESAGKLDKATGYRKLSVPVGVTTYLGLSVTPATANQNFTVNYDTDKSDGADYTILGDAFTPNEEGTYYVTATSAGIGADGEQVESATYEITAYKQGGSIVWNDSSYAVVGGFLMKKGNVDTDSEHTFVPGDDSIAFTAPTNGEDITWTSNNPAGLAVWEDSDDVTMHVKPLQPGTYTVTGKSARTAQKYTFKVLVGKNCTATATTATAVKAISTKGGFESGNISGLEKGQTVQLALDVDENVAGTVKWTTSDKTVATVSGKGLVKIVNKNNDTTSCTITATMTLNDKDGKKAKEVQPVVRTITITPQKSTVTVIPKNVPVAAKAGTPFKISASVKNAKITDIKWSKEDASGTKTALTVDEKGKTATIDAAGTYKIYANDGTKDISAGEIVVSTNPVSKLAVIDGPEGQLSVKDLKNKKVGLQNENKVATDDSYAKVNSATVYVKATAADKTAAADPGAIIWTSSNANVVTLESVTPPTVSNDTYAGVKVTVKSGTKYNGKVTITGVSKNGGKKVSFVVMVNDGATAEAQKVAAPAAPAENS